MKTVTTILFSFIYISCAAREKDESVVLARVGERSLTVNQLEIALPAKNRTNSQLRSFINEWVDNTLLYNAAIKNGFHQDQSLVAAKDRYFKKLIIASFIQAETFGKSDINNDDIRAYYDAFSDGFIRGDDEALIYHFITKNLTEARKIRSVLNEEKSGDAVDELFNVYGVEAKTVTRGLLIEKLDYAIFSETNDVLHGPLRTNNGYHVIKVMKRYKKGSQAGLAKTYDEIYQRLLKEKQVDLSNKLLDSLKAETPVFINSNFQ